MYRRSQRGRTLLLVFVVLSTAMITLDFRTGPGGPVHRLKGASSSMVAPMQRGFTAVTRPVTDFLSSLAGLGRAHSRVAELEAELERAQAHNRQARGLIEDNERLRTLLGIDEPWFAMDKVHAEVIGQDSSNYKWAIVVDKGAADGLRADMAVVNGAGLVGKVIGVHPHSATVLLLVDPDAGAGVLLEGGRDRGVIRGNGSDRELTLEWIGTNTDVSVGDRVITSGYDMGIFPRGIPVGIVTRVSALADGLDKDVGIEPAVDFADLDYVTVLLDSGARRSRRPTERR